MARDPEPGPAAKAGVSLLFLALGVRDRGAASDGGGIERMSDGEARLRCTASTVVDDLRIVNYG